MQTKKESGLAPMFGKLAMISGCDGAKHPQYAITPQSIHNKVSQQVDSKVILEDCIPHPKSRAIKTFGKLCDLLNLLNNKDYH
ncbi:hypothetical protein [Nostoc favosum]|uniref:Uncharacterized protein n=1 Tax=Nostoc favosum CHAB5714 TaxID=2780399 RepID=A0ABS8IBY2_9NOSO|nr:hypothetical protein [Nostoc favosum]MCC5601622.1 hypothetical protein [Nostoc favosum CHAB5714]